MRALKIVLIVLVVVVVGVTLFHALGFHGPFFLGVPYVRAGGLLSTLSYGIGAVVAFVLGKGVRRPGLKWLKIVLYVAGTVLAILAVLGLARMVF
jgi:hypothetical protein